MALDAQKMYNQNSKHPCHSAAGVVGGAPPPMSPRISFSNDFVVESTSHSLMSPAAVSYSDTPVSDFEFSFNNFPMMSADELFFKGRLLPLKEDGGGEGQKTTTLRDELSHEEEEEEEEDGGDDFSLLPPKNQSRWRGFLGLRKSDIGSKNSEKMAYKTTTFQHEHPQGSKNSQDFSD